MKVTKIFLIFFFGLIGILLCFFLSIAVGAKVIPFETIQNALLQFDSGNLDHIILAQRVPRTVFAILAGCALGISGVLMQAITRNPIADPSILGVNSGAGLAVVTGIAFFGISSLQGYIWFALIGAALSSVFVYFIGSLGYGGATPIKLALAGAAVSAAASSLISGIMLPRTNVMNDFRFWQVGSVGGATWDSIRTVLPFLLTGFFISALLTSSLNILVLGDQAAKGLGVRTGLVRLLGAFCSVLLCGSVTALAGPIGFIGLMIPHAMRLMLGSDHRILMPASALYGAVLLLAADIIGRIAGRPGELESGIVTALLGAPVFIVIVRKAKVSAL